MRFLILVLFFSNFSYSQTEGVPFNQLDDKGEKHGYWKMYVDSNCNLVSDTNKANWYYFNLYYHGKTVGGFKTDFVDKESLEKINFTKRPEDDKNKIEPINGEFEIEIKNKDSSTYRFIIELGFIKELHQIHQKDGTNWEIYDYSKKFDNNPYSFFYRSFHPFNKGKIRETFYYYDGGKFKKKKSSREVQSSNYYDNMKKKRFANKSYKT